MMEVRLRQALAAQKIGGIAFYLDKKDKILKFSLWRTITRNSLIGDSQVARQLNHEINLSIANQTRSLDQELRKRYRDGRKCKEIIAKIQKQHDESMIT
jgi:hypothetical protein